MWSERNADFYDSMYRGSEEYSKHYADSIYYAIWCVLLDRLQPRDDMSVLEIGCGPGQLASYLFDRGLRDYVGLDFSEECIQMAKTACPSFEFVCDDALVSDLLTRCHYNVVIATEVLEHVEDDIKILNRIRGRTHVYASVPSFPYESHVRYFKSAEEVRNRYERHFESFRVDEFLHGGVGMSLFLFEGYLR